MGAISLSVVGSDGRALPEWPRLELRVEGPQPLDWHVPKNIATWGNSWTFTYDDQAQALSLRLTLPADAPYWSPLEGTLTVAAGGVLSKRDAPQLELFEVGAGSRKTYSLVAHCTRLRDVTRELVDKLDVTPPASLLAMNIHDDRITRTPLPGGAPIQLAPFQTFQNKKVARSSAAWMWEVEQATVAPRTDARILEIKSGGAARFVAVSFPSWLPPDPEVPFLVMIRNQVGQTFDYTGYDRLLEPLDPANPSDIANPYSKGWGFLAYGFWQWLCFQWDPLVGDPEPPADPRFVGAFRPQGSMTDTRMGFAFQMEAARKNVALVIPLNRPEPDGHGDFLSAGSAHQLLKEISAFMLARRDVYRATVGRTAYAGFSSGHLALERFITNSEAEIARNPSGPHRDFFDDKLLELYFFDPPISDGAGRARQVVVPAALRWAQNRPDKIIRLYCNAPDASDNQIVPAPPGGPVLFRSSPDLTRSVTLIGVADWIKMRRSLMTGTPPRPVMTSSAAGIFDHPDGPHPLYCALFLKDALERSGFLDVV